MIKPLCLLICILIITSTIYAQSEKISNHKVKNVIDKLEQNPFELTEVKTLKKWKALGLSKEMKPQMNYNVILVKYKIGDKNKTVLIDMNLVPIDFNYNNKLKKTKKKKVLSALTSADYEDDEW